MDGDLQAFGGRHVHFDLGVSYPRARGNINMSGIYSERLFLAYRGFGGPDCGVGVTPDPTSAARMALGRPNGAVADRGPCMYLNPFSNAIQYSQQPGSRFENEANPTWRLDLANNPALMAWLDDEVDLVSTTDLVVADATLSGPWVEGVADYAFGYQYRGFSAAGDPTDPTDAGDVAGNPCPIRGAADCAAGDRFGPYAFTNVQSAYARSQTVQRLFGEIALNVGPRLDSQLAANYEIHDVANSFDPKFGWRLQVAESIDYSLVLRGAVQTTFRTPSLDDLNEDAVTTLDRDGRCVSACRSRRCWRSCFTERGVGYRIPRPGGLRVGYARASTRTRSMRTRRTPSARRRSGRRWRTTGPPSRHCAVWA